MELLFEYKPLREIAVSIVLLDWAVRESCHILDYLNKQEIDRGLYEIIWIEYYDRKQKEIETGLKKSAASNSRPIVDKWVILHMPRDVYYHKHLMYNAGILLSSGRIVTFCDSDAFMKPTFVKSIINAFNENENIVLHMDEVRNMSRKFYPFSYPSFDEITGPGCINWSDSKPRGLADLSDPLHLRNYGACMSALRKDLISIGGADEHIDYLGHICGVYDMTFRLINLGKRETWHGKEWLYHVWHPGQAGRWNYLGPHDGRHMSTTALEVIKSGRIMPLVENPAINARRVGRQEETSRNMLLSQVIPDKVILKKWRIKRTIWDKIKYWIENVLITARDWIADKTRQRPLVRRLYYAVKEPASQARKLAAQLRLFLILPKMIIRQLYIKISVPSRGRFKFIERRSLIKKFSSLYRLLIKVWEYDRNLIKLCRQCLDRLYKQGVNEIVIFGSADIARILYVLSKPLSLEVKAVIDDSQRKIFLGRRLISPEKLNRKAEKIIVASLVNIGERVRRLKDVGIEEGRIVTL